MKYPALPLAWDPSAGVYRYVGIPTRGLSGVSAQTGTQITATAGTAASGIITSAATSGAIAASTAAIAVPIIGAAVLAVTLVIGSIARKNAQKKAATKIVDEVGPQMKANLEAYLSGPRTRSSQRQALYNFDVLWQLILDNCGQESLGSAGRRCIEERQRGGVAPWCPTPDKRGCDAFSVYRDPIENDSQVKDDPVSNLASELFPNMTAEQIGNAPKYAGLVLLALGAAFL